MAMASSSVVPSGLPPLQISVEGNRLRNAFMKTHSEISRLLKDKQFGAALEGFRSLRDTMQTCWEHFVVFRARPGEAGAPGGDLTVDPHFVFRILECEFFQALFRAKRMWNSQLMRDPDLRGRLGLVGLLDSWAAFDEQVTAARRKLLGSEECHHVFPAGSVRPVVKQPEGESILTAVEMAEQIKLGRCGFLRSEVAADLARARHLAEAMCYEDPNRLQPLFDVLTAEAKGAESTEDRLQKLRRVLELAEAVVLRDEYPGGGNFEAWLANGEPEEGRTKRTAPSRPLLPYGSPSGTQDVDVERGLTYAEVTWESKHADIWKSKQWWGEPEYLRRDYGYLRWWHLVAAYHMLAELLERRRMRSTNEVEFLVDKAWKCQQKFSGVWDAFFLLQEVLTWRRLVDLDLGKQGVRNKSSSASRKKFAEMATFLIRDLAKFVENGDARTQAELRLLSETAMKNTERCFQRATQVQLCDQAFELAPLSKGPGRLPPGTIPEWVECDASAEEVFIEGQANLEVALLAARTGKHWDLEESCVRMRLAYLDDREAASDLTRVLPTHDREGHSVEVRGRRLFEGDNCPICGEVVFVSVDDKWDEALKPLRSLREGGAGASETAGIPDGNAGGCDQSTNSGQRARNGTSTGTKAVGAPASSKGKKETQKKKRERQARERAAAKSATEGPGPSSGMGRPLVVQNHTTHDSILTSNAAKAAEILLSDHCSDRDDPIGNSLQRRPGVISACAHGVHKRCKHVVGALLTFTPSGRCHICSEHTVGTEVGDSDFLFKPTTHWFTGPDEEGDSSEYVFKMAPKDNDFCDGLGILWRPAWVSPGDVDARATSGLEDRYEEVLRRAGMMVHNVDGSSSSAEEEKAVVPSIVEVREVEDSSADSLLAHTSRRLQRNAKLALGHCVFRLELDTESPLDRGQTCVIATERIRKGETIYQDLSLLEFNINGTDAMGQTEAFRLVRDKFRQLPDHIKTSFLELHDDRRKYTNELCHHQFFPLCAPDKFRELFPNFEFAQLAKILTQNHGATRFSTIGKTIMGVFASNAVRSNFGQSVSVYDFSARVRHSCRANAMVREHSPNLPFHAVVALRDIAVGEEICISHVNLWDFHLAAAEQRVKILKEDWLIECRADGCVCRGLMERGNQDAEVSRSDERCKQIRSLVAEFERARDGWRLAAAKEERVFSESWLHRYLLHDEEGAPGSCFGSEDCESQVQRAEELVERISAECDAERLSLPGQILKYRMQLAYEMQDLHLSFGQQRGAVRPGEGEGGAMSFAEGLKIRFDAQIEKAEECATLLEGPAPREVEVVVGEGGDRDSIAGVVGPVTRQIRKKTADYEKRLSAVREILSGRDGRGRFMAHVWCRATNGTVDDRSVR